jgi:hypothetical protein
MLKVPAVVLGPRTRWRIALEYYGKNYSHAALVATCLTNGRTLTLVDGRERVTPGMARNGFLVEAGTVKCRLMAAAVAQGVAEFGHIGEV